jgi:radical SAM superfamily enzyme YgiQ (UPF0313 family)
MYDRIMERAASIFSPNVHAYMTQKYIASNTCYVFMTRGYYDRYITEEITNETVMVTCINFGDLLMVKYFLEKGNKVILGGPLVNIQLSARFIRNFLFKMGIHGELQEKLIVVSGDIDLYTDLNPFLSAWKDGAITRNDYTSIYECKEDFLEKLFNRSPSTAIHVGFSNKCWYGKCKFCTYKGLPEMDFLDGVDREKVIGYFQTIKDKFGAKELRFIDPYFAAKSEDALYILEQIKNSSLTVFAGILLLKSRKYIEFLNPYVNTLLIGLESASDFSLESIQKGYRWADIEKAVDSMIKYLDKRIFLEISTILDLPARDRNDVKTNYRRILEIKERFEAAGFRVGVHMNILSSFPNLDVLNGGAGSLRLSGRPEEMEISTGKNYLIHLLKKAGMDAPLLLPSGELIKDPDNPSGLNYGYLCSDVPVLRYDVHGELLPSDLLLMEEEVMKGILGRKSKRAQEVGAEAEESPRSVSQ